MSQIVDVVAPLITRFPSLASPLASFARTVTAAVDGVSDLIDAEPLITEAVDALALAGLSEVLAAHRTTASVVEVDGRRYRRVRDASRRTYFGLRGPMSVERHLYREVGVHNGPTIVPLELSAGLVDGLWTPLAAAAAGHLLQDEPSRDAVATCRALRVGRTSAFSQRRLSRSHNVLVHVG